MAIKRHEPFDFGNCTYVKSAPIHLLFYIGSNLVNSITKIYMKCLCEITNVARGSPKDQHIVPRAPMKSLGSPVENVGNITGSSALWVQDFCTKHETTPQIKFEVMCCSNLSVPTKTQLSNFLGTPGEKYFKGNPKSLNFYFLVIWWGKSGKL